MELRTNVHSTARTVRTEEHNYGHVYVRFNITQQEVTIDGRTYNEYVYDEYFMTEYEYQQIQQGHVPMGLPWTEPLRSIEREFLYSEVDKLLMKFTSYAPDAEKVAIISQYKSAIHQTVQQENYPTKVTYPTFPIL